MTDPVVMQPTVVLRYFFNSTPTEPPYWRYDWFDDTITFAGGGKPTRTKRFNSLQGVLAALLADGARTLTVGTSEEDAAEPS